MMNEREAWITLATAFANADGYGLAEMDCFRFSGLCTAVTILNVAKHVRRKMDAKIKQEAYRLKTKEGFFYWSFIWPITKAGAEQRAAFCRRMAKEL
jgi:hypothetical protein